VANAALHRVREPLTADTGRTNRFATQTGPAHGLTTPVAPTSAPDADDLQVGVGHEDAG
jgi:hypothetical protein